ncbi:hypothetical protein G4G28_21630 [Massilia sp. Dwa41.01b]|uniref:hypothetical protein n=1 Tax=unclassified Massilia TaxID=2609279 RepID=UPI0015FFE06D|nr:MULTISPECIES: hypothetical protein [unclassified Massilia]QNA90446.1 hypothetical protein G4G28_21630 [Massilia sp. Dwa41.01b]QNA97677.1 hypothetical protein G4G31_00715 [Massilia sp. Se16.2.3]
MITRLAVLLFPLLLLTGCVSLTPTLAPTAQPEANAGYVAGQFSRNKGMNFALVLRAADSQEEYVMPMGADSSLPTEVVRSPIAIKVRPGTYTITQWLTYATLTKEVISRQPIQSSPLAKPFTVAAGAVTHLGNFRVISNKSATFGGVQFDMRILPDLLSEPEMKEDFAAAYPNLASQPVRCVYCTDTYRP